MHSIIEMIHYFSNWSIDNKKRRSANKPAKHVLKQAFRETINGHQTFPHKGSFAGNKSIAKRDIKGHQFAENCVHSRCLLRFNVFLL